MKTSNSDPLVWKLILLPLLIGLFTACSAPPALEHLTKLSFERELELRSSQDFDLSESEILDRDRNVVSVTHLDSIKKGLVGFDHYVNTAGTIEYSVIRDRMVEDDLIASVMLHYDHDARNEDTETIDCDDIKTFINTQYDIKPGLMYGDVKLTGDNYYNIRKLRYSAFLNNCTSSDLMSNDNETIRRAWLEYQHSGRSIMATYYYPMFHELFQEDRYAEYMALSVDRILASGGYSQVYGSQIIDYKLWPIRDTTNLDSIRVSMGMEPMEIYLERFDLN